MKKTKPMDYKNVNKRIKRLANLGLIEKTNKLLFRNAIQYKLTTRGLFQRLLMQPEVNIEFLDRNRDNIILKTILYQYFEERTISEFGNISIVLAIYLHDCCRAILERLEKISRFVTKVRKHSMKDFTKERVEFNFDELIDTGISNEQIANLLNKRARTFDGFIDDNMEKEQMDEVINKQVRRLVLKIITEAMYEHREDNRFVSSYPNIFLKKDEKFMSLLREIKKDFDDGSRAFLT